MTTPLPPGASSPEDRMVIIRRFIRQAREELERDDRLQASEKTWGAMAHALKAIAQIRGWRHRSHNCVLDVGRQIGMEYNFPDIIIATEYANSLHQNFYENNDNAEVIERTINLIEDILLDLEAIQSASPRPFTISRNDHRDRLRQLTGNRSLQIGDSSPVGFSLRHTPGPDIGDERGNGAGTPPDGNGAAPR